MFSYYSKIYSLSFPTCKKTGLTKMLVRVVKPPEQRHYRNLHCQKKEITQCNLCIISLCFHRQGSGSLCYGSQPVSHTGLGLPDDLQEHDSSGCHWASIKTPMHLAKPGLLEAAERTGHSVGTAEEEYQNQPTIWWWREQHHDLVLFLAGLCYWERNSLKGGEGKV